MTFRALADSFATASSLPIRVDDVLDWIRTNTDHKIIELHGVRREHKGFRGGFRRKAIPVGGTVYNQDVEIVSQVLYGLDSTKSGSAWL
jgi:hypothetical protein